jgi:beta-galactosidase
MMMSPRRLPDRKHLSPPAALLALLLTLFLSAHSVDAQAVANPNWPGPGQLFVGACYQPIDRSPEEIDRDIAIT